MPPSAAAAPIPAAARDFLVQAGLPASIVCFDERANCLSHITFRRLAAGLAPVLSEPTVGPPLPPEWSRYFILGDELFANGSAWWCIDQRTGQVDRIDIELGDPIQLVNSGVAQLASALLAAWLSSESCRSLEKVQPAEVERLSRDLTALDPASMSSRRSFWPMYLDFRLHNKPPAGSFRNGSRAEGDRALQAGPW